MIEDAAGVEHSRSETRSPVRAGFAAATRRAGKVVFAAADLLLGAWPGPRILIYHQVGKDSGREMEVSSEAFVRQLDWLERDGRIAGLDEALVDPDHPEARETYVLTFDDGYESLYRNAFPVLRDRQLPFVLYLATESIDTGQGLAPGDTPLTWDQVGEMVQSGLVTIGSHTHRHPDLRDLSADEVEEDLATSNALIEGNLGVAPEHFAYPKGYWAPDAEAAVRRHYRTAVLGAGHPVTGDTDRHRLCRVPIQRTDAQFLFRRKIKRGMRLEELVRSRVKGYRNPRNGKNGAR